MTRLRSFLRTCSLSSLPALLGAPAFAQLPEYDGGGFAGPTWTELSAEKVELLDLDGDGLQDLAALESDGAVTLNRDLATHSRWDRLEGFEAIGVTRTGGDRLWGVQAGSLVELLSEHFTEASTPAASGPSFSALVSFDLQDRPSGARLVAVDLSGARLRVFTLDGDFWSLETSRSPTVAQNKFHDAVLVDWDGQSGDEVALISDLGLHVYAPTGQEVLQLGGESDEAFLDVLPGSRVKWGRDLLAYHHRPNPQADHLIWFANADHGEVHWTTDFHVREVVLADLLAAPGAELAVALGSSEDIWILRQTAGGTPQDPIFAFDLYDVFNVVVDMPGAVTVAPAMTAADVDHDGDDDLVLIDDRGNKIVVTSERFDEELLRPGLEVTPSVTGDPKELRLNFDVALPTGATGFALEIWAVAAPYEDGPTLLHTETGVAGADQSLSIPVASGTDPVYQLVFRATSTTVGEVFPATVLAWTELPAVQDPGEVSGASYVWALFDDGGGGTTRDPVTGPPAGGGGTGGGTGSGGSGG